MDELAAARAALTRFSDVYGADAPPVDVEELAASLCRLRVCQSDDLGAVAGAPYGMPLSGLLIPHRWEIWVRRDEPHQRRRFTVAHEVGHHLLHSDRGTVMCRPVDVDQAEPADAALERQANRFAAELLMPEPLVRAAADRDGADPVALGQLFDVSDVAMAFRLVTLEYLENLPPDLEAKHLAWKRPAGGHE